MKRIAILAVMLAALMTANATSVLYFTRSQAERAVNYLNRQSELMIYCGYDYEIETYVLLNEVWAERVNSAFYELWIYGYDAYTGDEIYMPIDLQCIWLYSAGRMYNAAQYLRFRTDGSLRRPMMTWTVPAYNPYARVNHRPGYTRTYHYEVHRHGWMPPAPPAPGHHGTASHPLPPYYMRAPHEAAPHPVSTWTPGVENPRIEHPAPSRSSSGVRPTPTGNNAGGSNTQPPATQQQSGTATSAPTRSTSGTSTSAPTRSGSSQTGSGKTTAPTRSNSSSTAPRRSGSAPSTAPTRSSSSQNKDNKETKPAINSGTSTAPTRSGSTTNSATSTAPTRSTSTTRTAPTRSSSTQSDEKKTTAPTRSSAPTRR